MLILPLLSKHSKGKYRPWKKGKSRKSKHDKNIIAQLMVRLGIITTPVLSVIIKSLVIKVVQPLPWVKEIPTNIIMIPDEWEGLFKTIVKIKK